LRQQHVLIGEPAGKPASQPAEGPGPATKRVIVRRTETVRRAAPLRINPF
jgi:hypothetical protein